MKQKEIKLLVVADTIGFKEKSVIEGLNRFCRRKFDAVICLGDNSPIVIQEADCLYPKTAKLCLYGDNTSSRPYREFGFQNINNEIVFQADTSYYGYASHKFNPNGPDEAMFSKENKADIFITTNNPCGIHENPKLKQDDTYPEINKYIEIQKPIYTFHAGQQIKQTTKLEEGSVRGCYGVLAITIIQEGIPLAEQKKLNAQKRREERAKKNKKTRKDVE